MLLRPSINIFTNSFLIKKARENVLEFLLINHPLDCPICDQGGECDLQDQTLLFGNDRGRFYELKKVTKDKNCNPFIKTIMTRCIHCTRCIRFLNDLNLDYNLGMLGRGNKMEISNYLEQTINTELASNIIDLCPVGALTSKLYSFKARPWELFNLKSFDIYDIMNATITIFLQGVKLVRILPYNNELINDQWLSDRSRYFFDSLYNQRVINPYKYSLKFKKFILINWFFFYKFIFYLKKNIFKFNKIFLLLNINFLNFNDIIFLKNLNIKNINLNSFNLNVNYNKLNIDFRNYIINKKNFLNKIKNDKIIILLNNYNLRLQNPILYLEIIKNYKYNNNFNIFSIQNNLLNNTIIKNLNFNKQNYLNFLKGKNFFNIFFLKNIYYFNYELIILNNLNFIFLEKFKLFNNLKITNYFLNSNLFDLNKSEFNLNYNLKYIYKKNYLNIILEDHLYLNNFFYTKYLNFFLINILLTSHNLYNLTKNLFYTFDFILPLNIYLENNITSFNFYGIFQKSFKINNWAGNSKSLNYYIKFLFLCLNFKISNLNNIHYYIFKCKSLNYIKIKKIINYKNILIINWFNQLIIKDFYKINNFFVYSNNLKKNTKKLYSNFKK
jgi:hypothetical protein